MEITNDTVEWDSIDINAFANFLRTRTGQKLIPKILESVPPLHRGGPINEILIRTGEVHAWGEAARTILSLAAPPPPPPDELKHSNQYPDPTDDSKWEDGQKTT